ncbi:MAG: hypothetical protein FIA90_13505 [candidate division NC10 bacterium]|nr:hypothetical protein [candidate division NC10 bacterium]
MTFLNALLGFTVLTGPLWLIIVVLAIAIWVAVKVARRVGGGGATKMAVGVLVFLGVFFVPFADEMAGRIYLNYLCATEAGVKVYQTVELPAEYWDEQGKPRYLASNGFVDMKLLPNRFAWHKVNEAYIDSVIKIEKWRWQLMDKETQTVLGERITYMRYFGWINHFSPAPNIGEGCRYLGGQKERQQEQDFFRDILKSASSIRQG